MMAKKTAASYSPEVRERAVRMVLDGAGEHGSQWAAIGSIAAKIGEPQGNARGFSQRQRR
jgi:transposase-like protein